MTVPRPAIRFLLCSALLLALSACTPAAPPAPTGAAPPAGVPFSEWDQVLAAAKREGKVVVYGPPGADIGRALSDGFRRAYPEIELDFTGEPSPTIVPRLLNERAAGQYLADILIFGSITFFNQVMPQGGIDPIQPFLVGPEGKDASKWRDGKLYFADTAGSNIIVMVSFPTLPVAYNPSLVSPSDIKSYRDLLDPKWKGKIVMKSPRVPGLGQSLVSIWYNSPSLGADFLEKLIPAVTFSEDDRQIIEWITKGDYAIALGPSASVITPLLKAGVPLGLIHGSDIAEGTWLASGGGTLAIANRLPHPNAAAVYLNWILSQPAQAAYVEASGYPSRRTDVSTDSVLPVYVPKPGVAYTDLDVEDSLPYREHAMTFVQPMLP